MNVCFKIDGYSGRERRVFSAPPSEVNVYLSKAPHDIMTVGPILRVHPSLHVICMIRDPRDTVTSMHGKAPDRYWAGLKFWKAYIPFWQKVRSHPRFTTIKYEDFVADPDETQDQLVGAIPFLEQRAPFSKYHEVAAPSQFSKDALGSVRPIRPTSVGRWRNHRSRVAGQLDLHGPITEDLIAFGYEEDDSWLQELEGVEPDKSPSHHSEQFSRTDLWVRRSMGYIGALIVLARRMGVEPLKIVDWIPRRWIPSQI
ncbi:sulfotransferase family protein [Salinibacter ruber]|uniref:sulfotransferase family protein n=1 Tax=Salinibacter ruber TaxID=146919 RepID=UPI002168F733|nr:sulfotransferase [Salinibacter ruber]